MGPTFDYRTTVTLGDTNALGNMYFANFFKLQGIVRKLWVQISVESGREHLRSGLILSTKSAHCDYRKPIFAMDDVLCRMHIENLGRVRATLVFEFFAEETMRLHASGWQIIVFKDADRKTCRMPEDFQAAAEKITWSDTSGLTEAGVSYEEAIAS